MIFGFIDLNWGILAISAKDLNGFKISIHLQHLHRSAYCCSLHTYKETLAQTKDQKKVLASNRWGKDLQGQCMQ